VKITEKLEKIEGIKIAPGIIRMVISAIYRKKIQKKLKECEVTYWKGMQICLKGS